MKSKLLKDQKKLIDHRMKIMDEFFSGDLGIPFKLQTQNIFQKAITFIKSLKKRPIDKSLYIQMAGRALRKPKYKFVMVSPPYSLEPSPFNIIFLDKLNEKRKFFHPTLDTFKYNLESADLISNFLMNREIKINVHENFKKRLNYDISDLIEEGYISHPIICKVY